MIIGLKKQNRVVEGPAISHQRLPFIKEHEILRISGSLLGQDPDEAMKSARLEVLKWAQKRCGGKLSDTAWACDSFERFSGGRDCIGIRLQAGKIDIWTIRVDYSDTSVPGRTWTTEVTIGKTSENLPRLSVRLTASTAERELIIEPHVPGFIQQLSELPNGVMIDSHKMSATPWDISSEMEIEELISWLIDPRRKLPILVLSTGRNDDGTSFTLVQADLLAKATQGIAHVVILPSALAWHITEKFGKQKSVFGGAVRAYLTGFSAESDPHDHRLFFADGLRSDENVARCTRWLRQLAASESLRRTRLGEDVVTFSSVREAYAKVAQQKLEQEGAPDIEQLEAAKRHISALEKQLEEEKVASEYYVEAEGEAVNRAAVAENLLRAATFKIQSLTELLNKVGASSIASIDRPKSWGEIVNWCNAQFAGQLVLAPTAIRGLKKPEFEDISLVVRCLEWLATVCRERFIGGGGGSLRDVIIEQGIINAHCGGDQYDIIWEGRNYTADWHIKPNSNTRNPKYCLRIYYFWEEDTRQIVVTDLPAHRRTDAT